MIISSHSPPSNTISTSILGLILSALGTTGQVITALSILVFSTQIHDDLARSVELAQAVPKGVLALVLLQKGVSLPQAVVLEDDALEQGGDARVVGQHQAADLGRVGGCCVGRGAGQGDLDGGWAPGDELGEAAFADAEEGFVDLGFVLVLR